MSFLKEKSGSIKPGASTVGLRRFLRVYKRPLFLSVPVILLAVLASLTGDKQATTIETYIASLFINIIAAFWWFEISKSNEHSAAYNAPFARIFPFAKEPNALVTIILASFGCGGDFETTGVGEALALGILQEKLCACGMSRDNISVRFSSHYKDEKIIKGEMQENNLIILGGPIYNECTKAFFDVHKNGLEFIFTRDGSGANMYSGAIERKGWEGDDKFVVAPVPIGVVKDIEVTVDCGIISRVRNRNGTIVTVISGGRTAGVWLGARLMSTERLIEEWSKKLQEDGLDMKTPHNLNTGNIHDFQIVFKCPVLRLSASELDINPIGAKKISQQLY